MAGSRVRVEITCCNFGNFLWTLGTQKITMQQDKLVLSFLGEGESVQIFKTFSTKSQGRFILKTTTQQEYFKTFVRAFKRIDKDYPWYYLHLDFLEECYKEILRVKLVEHRQKSSFNKELYQYAEMRFEKVLGNDKVLCYSKRVDESLLISFTFSETPPKSPLR